MSKLTPQQMPLKQDSRREMRVERSIAGPVLLEFGNALNGYRIALSDQDAIRLCDALRRVIEQPTKAQPSGKNVFIMDMETLPNQAAETAAPAAGNPPCPPTPAERAEAMARLRPKLRALKSTIDDMSKEQWDDWVDALPPDEFLEYIGLGEEGIREEFLRA